MALTATIFRIELELSDIDRSVYRTESLRVAQHPSEETERLVARVLTFALCWEERLTFARDLADTEEPALWSQRDEGGVAHWIEVGTTKAKRLHIKSKLADKLTVAIYRGLDDGRDALRREVSRTRVHGAETIDVLVLPGALVADVAAAMDRSSAWVVIHSDDSLQVIVDGVPFEGTVRRTSLADL